MKAGPQVALAVATALLVVAIVAWEKKKKSDGFRPVRVSACARGPSHAADTQSDPLGRFGTVAPLPEPSQYASMGAQTPEVAAMSALGPYSPNPVTGIGKSATVRALGDKYRGSEQMRHWSIYGLQPGQPGFMEEAESFETADTHAASRPPIWCGETGPWGYNAGGRDYMEETQDSSMCLMSKIARRPPLNITTGGPPAAFDSDFLEGMRETPMEPRQKETLVSRRRAAPNELTASRTGLGSIRRDPRFEPGPQMRVASGDASPAHGGHAGGITLGAFGSERFPAGPHWDWPNLTGNGPTLLPYETLVTASE